MAEDFTCDDARKLLHNKFVIVIGDSVQRGVYKDLVYLCHSQRNSYIPNRNLRDKGEASFLGDELIEGGTRGEMTNQTHYREIRQYKTEFILIRFYFITKVYNDYFETIVEDLCHESSPKPDVIMMNSCLWDMSRYGPRWLDQYRLNLDKMLNAIKVVVQDALFIWLTCMPVGKKARGGFLPRGVEWKKGTFRLDVLEANFFATQAVTYHGFDVLDLNSTFRDEGLTELRSDDDIHWRPPAHRKISCMILRHICEAWNVTPPRHMQPLPLDMEIPQTYRQHRRNMSTPAAMTHSLRQVQNNYLDFNNNNQQFCNRNLAQQPMMTDLMNVTPIMFCVDVPQNWGGNYGMTSADRQWRNDRYHNSQKMMRRPVGPRSRPY